VTVTLPSPARIVLALALIAAVFAAAFAVGRSHRPAPPRVGPAGPVPVQPSAAAAPTPMITAPPTPPPLPALKLLTPRVRVVSAVRERGVV
jgi:hypothetical protein